MHDEISIKADLVYDVRSGELVGFIDGANFSAKSAAGGHLATHALEFMVVGITSNLKMAIPPGPQRRMKSSLCSGVQ